MIYIKENKTKKIPGLSSLFVNFEYKKEIIDIIKQCTPANYEKKDSTWEIPITRLAKFVNQSCKYDDIELKLLNKPDTQENIEEKKIDLSVYKTKPYTYQVEGIEYGLKHDCWLLLDQPGLGKTLQIIYLAEELRKREGIQHCLIICGINTLKTNWEKEINKHSKLDCKIIGKRINRKGSVYYSSISDRIKDLKNPIDEFFVIVNIESLRSTDLLKQIKNGTNKFDMIVVDEIHVCKNPNNQQTHNLLKLNNSKFRIGLTGTPILNSPLDSYVPLKWTGNDNSTYTNFKYQYCIFGGNFNNEIVGYKNIDLLKDQIESCSLRRTKDILDLPEKTIIDEILDMNSSQELLYNNVVNGILQDIDKVKITTGNLLSMVTRLRQATACPQILTTTNIPSTKIDRCVELVNEIVSNKNKVVIFSVFKETLNILNQLLIEYKPLLCTGDVSDDIISQNIDLFQNGDENKVILCTTSKMGTGITLNRASYAIFVDTPWTSALTEQCEDRIHRIGTKNKIFIYRLHCNNTIDIKVKRIVQNKEAIGNYIVDNIRDEKTIDLLKGLIREL